MSKFVRTCLGIMSGLLIMITPMESRGLKNNLSIQDESIAFKCLLNIPMGISPAELKTYFSGCSGVKFTSNYSGEEIISSNIDISGYDGEVIYDLILTKYKENTDSLSDVSFSFFQGKLYSIDCAKDLDKKRSKEILSEFERRFGASKIKKNTRSFTDESESLDHEFQVKSHIWVTSGTSITFDPADDYEEVKFIIQNDSLTKVVDEIKNTNVEVQVASYSLRDAKMKETIEEWQWDQGNLLQIPFCVGVGRIKLKGKGKDLTFTILCENGNVVFEKKGIVLKGSTQILKKDDFPEPDLCASSEVDGASSSNYILTSTNYTLRVSKKGHILFSGNILREECQD